MDKMVKHWFKHSSSIALSYIRSIPFLCTLKDKIFHHKRRHSACESKENGIALCFIWTLHTSRSSIARFWILYFSINSPKTRANTAIADSVCYGASFVA